MSSFLSNLVIPSRTRVTRSSQKSSHSISCTESSVLRIKVVIKSDLKNLNLYANQNPLSFFILFYF